ncbi:hypothetical protein [Lentzea sp. NPDC003310]|uniref:hypothetical protein n=1 Tax=Lentzea sp. NPDC003310 TaxID=3154447 RepID=UPI0033A1D6F3
MANTSHTPSDEPAGDESRQIEGRRPSRGWSPERTTALLNLLLQVVVLIGPIIDLFR